MNHKRFIWIWINMINVISQGLIPYVSDLVGRLPAELQHFAPIFRRVSHLAGMLSMGQPLTLTRPMAIPWAEASEKSLRDFKCSLLIWGFVGLKPNQCFR